MTREEAIKRLKEARNTIQPFRYVDEAIDYAIKALDQESCEEYESDLKTIIDDISKEGNQLISKKDILRRFKEVDEEYKGMSWNLLQILANINILIGQEPCDDCVSRQAVHDWIKENTEYDEDHCDYFFVMRSSVMHKDIDELTSVTPKRERGKWITQYHVAHQKEYIYCSECREEFSYDGETGIEMSDYKYCPNCGAEMKGVKG